MTRLPVVILKLASTSEVRKVAEQEVKSYLEPKPAKSKEWTSNCMDCSEDAIPGSAFCAKHQPPKPDIKTERQADIKTEEPKPAKRYKLNTHVNDIIVDQTELATEIAWLMAHGVKEITIKEVA